MNTVLQSLLKTAAVGAVVDYVKTNAPKLVHVASDAQVHRATVELAKAVRLSWRDAGPAVSPVAA